MVERKSLYVIVCLGSYRLVLIHEQMAVPWRRCEQHCRGYCGNMFDAKHFAPLLISPNSSSLLEFNQPKTFHENISQSRQGLSVHLKIHTPVGPHPTLLNHIQNILIIDLN
jgi:hypothetical protein